MPVTFNYTTVASPAGVQGSYPVNMAKWRNGQRAYANPGDDIVTGLLQAAAIPFGCFVCRDATGGRDDRAVIAITAASQSPIGIAILSDTFEPVLVGANNIMGYPQYQNASILRHGTVAVTVDEAVNIGSPVRVRITTAAASYTYRTSASAGATVLVAGAKFASKTTGAGIALVTLDYTSLALTAD